MVHRPPQTALGRRRTEPRRGPPAPPKVVAHQDRWKVQPEAEGYQGRKWGPAFAKERRLRARPQVVLGARGRAPSPTSCIPDRSAPLGSSGRGLHHRSGKDSVPPPSPHWSLYAALGRWEPGGRGAGSGARPWADPSPRCRGPQAEAPGRPRLRQPLP